MRIVVLSGGGRGDTQPYAALARGFAAAGHQVLFATVKEFVHLVEGSGVETWVSEFDARQILGTDDGQKMVSSGENPLRFLRHFSKMVEPIMERGTRDLVEVCAGADGLVLATMSLLTGTRGIERIGVPFLAAFPAPATATWRHPCVLFPELPGWVPGQRLYNRLSHWMFESLAHRFLGRFHQRSLERLPAPAFMQGGPVPILYGYSPEVVARPPDWPDHAQITGYWFLEDAPEWQPPAALEAFLAAGSPPVCVGFGSMNDRDPEGATRLVCEALERAGRRGVMITGWGGLAAGDLPDHVFMIDSVPHSWLFPQMAAVVHHCGAGTTAAGMRAGVATIGVPHMTDQFFWGRRVRQLGVGPAAIPRKKLTVEKLARAITAATTDTNIREAAAAMGEKIRAEDGVARAVELAVAHFEGRPRLSATPTS